MKGKAGGVVFATVGKTTVLESVGLCLMPDFPLACWGPLDKLPYLSELEFPHF